MSKVLKKFFLCSLICVLAITAMPTLSFNTGVAAPITIKAATKTYPTAWVQRTDMTQYSSSKLKASKAALVTAIVAAFGPAGLTAEKVATAIATALLSQYYVNSDVQNVYYSYEVYYRELGAGTYDSSGNYLGNYQIKVVEKTYSDSSMDDVITTYTTYYKSTSIYYW